MSQSLMQKKDKFTKMEVKKRKEALREVKIWGEFQGEIVENILLGMTLKVNCIDYLRNVVTFELVG